MCDNGSEQHNYQELQPSTAGDRSSASTGSEEHETKQPSHAVEDVVENSNGREVEQLACAEDELTVVKGCSSTRQDNKLLAAPTELDFVLDKKENIVVEASNEPANMLSLVLNEENTRVGTRSEEEVPDEKEEKPLKIANDDQDTALKENIVPKIALDENNASGEGKGFPAVQERGTVAADTSTSDEKRKVLKDVKEVVTGAGEIKKQINVSSEEIEATSNEHERKEGKKASESYEENAASLEGKEKLLDEQKKEVLKQSTKSNYEGYFPSGGEKSELTNPQDDPKAAPSENHLLEDACNEEQEAPSKEGKESVAVPKTDNNTENDEEMVVPKTQESEILGKNCSAGTQKLEKTDDQTEDESDAFTIEDSSEDENDHLEDSDDCSILGLLLMTVDYIMENSLEDYEMQFYLLDYLNDKLSELQSDWRAFQRILGATDEEMDALEQFGQPKKNFENDCDKDINLRFVELGNRVSVATSTRDDETNEGDVSVVTSTREDKTSQEGTDKLPSQPQANTSKKKECTDCKFCCQSFPNSAHLRSHFEMFHELTEVKPSEPCGLGMVIRFLPICPECDRRFDSLYNLNVHMVRRHREGAKNKQRSHKKTSTPATEETEAEKYREEYGQKLRRIFPGISWGYEKEYNGNSDAIDSFEGEMFSYGSRRESFGRGRRVYSGNYLYNESDQEVEEEEEDEEWDVHAYYRKRRRRGNNPYTASGDDTDEEPSRRPYYRRRGRGRGRPRGSGRFPLNRTGSDQRSKRTYTRSAQMYDLPERLAMAEKALAQIDSLGMMRKRRNVADPFAHKDITKTSACDSNPVEVSPSETLQEGNLSREPRTQDSSEKFRKQDSGLESSKEHKFTARKSGTVEAVEKYEKPAEMMIKEEFHPTPTSSMKQNTSPGSLSSTKRGKGVIDIQDFKRFAESIIKQAKLVPSSQTQFSGSKPGFIKHAMQTIASKMPQKNKGCAPKVKCDPPKKPLSSQAKPEVSGDKPRKKVSGEMKAEGLPDIMSPTSERQSTPGGDKPRLKPDRPKKTAVEVKGESNPMEALVNSELDAGKTKLKRGRPKKSSIEKKPEGEPDSVLELTAAGEKPKRKPGRPKKVVNELESEAQQEEKIQSVPSNPNTEFMQAVCNDKPKLKPGRPKKVSAEKKAEREPVKTLESGHNAVKPRLETDGLNKMCPEMEVESQVNETLPHQKPELSGATNPSKLKPGRPKKVDTAAESQSMETLSKLQPELSPATGKSKSKPGRPKKTTIGCEVKAESQSMETLSFLKSEFSPVTGKVTSSSGNPEKVAIDSEANAGSLPMEALSNAQPKMLFATCKPKSKRGRPKKVAVGSESQSMDTLSNLKSEFSPAISKPTSELDSSKTVDTVSEIKSESHSTKTLSHPNPELSASSGKPKSKPGRPKKVVTGSEIKAESQSMETLSHPNPELSASPGKPKSKPGRPKKVVSSSEIKAESQSMETLSHPNPELLASPGKPKSKPGRPKKVVTSSEIIAESQSMETLSHPNPELLASPGKPKSKPRRPKKVVTSSEIIAESQSMETLSHPNPELSASVGKTKSKPGRPKKVVTGGSKITAESQSMETLPHIEPELSPAPVKLKSKPGRPKKITTETEIEAVSQPIVKSLDSESKVYIVSDEPKSKQDEPRKFSAPSKAEKQLQESLSNSKPESASAFEKPQLNLSQLKGQFLEKFSNLGAKLKLKSEIEIKNKSQPLENVSDSRSEKLSAEGQVQQRSLIPKLKSVTTAKKESRKRKLDVSVEEDVLKLVKTNDGLRTPKSSNPSKTSESGTVISSNESVAPEARIVSGESSCTKTSLEIQSKVVPIKDSMSVSSKSKMEKKTKNFPNVAVVDAVSPMSSKLQKASTVSSSSQSSEIGSRSPVREAGSSKTCLKRKSKTNTETISSKLARRNYLQEIDAEACKKLQRIERQICSETESAPEETSKERSQTGS